MISGVTHNVTEEAHLRLSFDDTDDKIYVKIGVKKELIPIANRITVTIPVDNDSSIKQLLFNRLADNTIKQLKKDA